MVSAPFLPHPSRVIDDNHIFFFFSISGLEWTGMMFNPALASALTFNCRNHPIIEHFIVYWIAPLMTIATMEFIKRRLRQRRVKVE